MSQCLLSQIHLFVCCIYIRDKSQNFTHFTFKEYHASPNELHSVILAVLLSAFRTSVSKFGYTVGISWASTHLSYTCCTSWYVDHSEHCVLLAGCLPLLPPCLRSPGVCCGWLTACHFFLLDYGSWHKFAWLPASSVTSLLDRSPLESVLSPSIFQPWDINPGWKFCIVSFPSWDSFSLLRSFTPFPVAKYTPHLTPVLCLCT